MGAKFKFLMGDVDYCQYGGKWYRKVGRGRYHIMELMNWEEAIGTDAENIGATYNLSLQEVDVLATPYDRIANAIDGCSCIEEQYSMYELRSEERELRWKIRNGADSMNKLASSGNTIVIGLINYVDNELRQRWLKRRWLIICC
jgi:hypothetical protein